MLTMQRLSLLAIGAVCVATSALSGSPLFLVAAEHSALPNDASPGSEDGAQAAPSLLEAKDADCVDFGFDVETLDCRVCNLLALTLSMQLEKKSATVDASVAQEKQRATEEAVAKCQRCCTDVEAIDALTNKQQQYARVELEVCTCKFGRLPKIANFVNHHASNHARLEVKYMNARMPHLIFYDDDGEKKEEVSIASWDEDTISEFIEAKLKKQEALEAPVGAEDEEAKSETDDASDAATEEEEAPSERDDGVDSSEDSEVVEVEVTAEAE